jgi:hypothetical protein
METYVHDYDNTGWCNVLRWIWCLWCYSECISTPGKLEKHAFPPWTGYTLRVTSQASTTFMMFFLLSRCFFLLSRWKTQFENRVAKKLRVCGYHPCRGRKARLAKKGSNPGISFDFRLPLDFLSDLWETNDKSRLSIHTDANRFKHQHAHAVLCIQHNMLHNVTWIKFAENILSFRVFFYSLCIIVNYSYFVTYST